MSRSGLGGPLHTKRVANERRRIENYGIMREGIWYLLTVTQTCGHTLLLELILVEVVRKGRVLRPVRLPTGLESPIEGVIQKETPIMPTWIIPIGLTLIYGMYQNRRNFHATLLRQPVLFLSLVMEWRQVAKPPRSHLSPSNNL
jgi:hypothetical protein